MLDQLLGILRSLNKFKKIWIIQAFLYEQNRDTWVKTHGNYFQNPDVLIFSKQVTEKLNIPRFSRF